MLSNLLGTNTYMSAQYQTNIIFVEELNRTLSSQITCMAWNRTWKSNKIILFAEFQIIIFEEHNTRHSIHHPNYFLFLKIKQNIGI